MMHALPYDYPQPIRGADDAAGWRNRQIDVLIDAIAGGERAQLEGLPVLEVYSCLCSRIRAMGMQPAELNVLRVARWISGSDDGQHPSGVEAA